MEFGVQARVLPIFDVLVQRRKLSLLVQLPRDQPLQVSDILLSLHDQPFELIVRKDLRSESAHGGWLCRQYDFFRDQLHLTLQTTLEGPCSEWLLLASAVAIGKHKLVSSQLVGLHSSILAFELPKFLVNVVFLLSFC